MDIETQVAVMASELRAHITADEKQNIAIDDKLDDIKGMCQRLETTLRESVQRIHVQREEAVTTLRGEIKEVADVAEEAHRRIFNVKIWTLGGVVTAMGSLIMLLIERLKDAGPPVHP